jgi:tRNA1Val (adenine37-N6)-methyltransferase
MSNNYFSFKQFTVNQDKCSMKVSTDACIQGAWTPIGSDVKHVLDIGTGTGLLSLMLAQRNPDIHVDAIELDEDAALQAKQNVDASPWKDRINIIRADVRDYVFDKKYDFIICNPPFFQNSLLGPDAARNNVRHNTSLSFSALVNVLCDNLNTNGYISILLPIVEAQVFQALMQDENMLVFNELLISPKHGFTANRSVKLFSKNNDKGFVNSTELIIYAATNVYTTAFAGLLSPFYLNL